MTLQTEPTLDFV